jgi:hypothetical protein
MRTTVTLDDDVYEAAQALAQATGRKLGRVLSEMARKSIDSSSPRRREPSKTKGTARFPAFKVPPDARVIPASQIQKALDEDGF